MKKLILTVLMFGMGAMLTACPAQRNRESVNTQPGRPGTPNPGTGQPNGNRGPVPTNISSIWGEVTDPNLQTNVYGFIDSTKTKMGNIGSQNTGVFFQGQVTFASNQTIYQIMQAGQAVQINPTATFSIEIWDSLVGTPDADGKTVPQIVVSLAQVQGQVSPQNTELTFSDQYGSVVLRGTIVNDQFQGQMLYDNHTGLRSLGNFQIQVCGLFRCQ